MSRETPGTFWERFNFPSSLFLLLTFLVFGLRHISPGYSDRVSAHVIPYFLPALQGNRSVEALALSQIAN